MAAVVVPRCRYSRHPTATVTAIEDAPCCCGRHIVLVATIVVLVVASSSVHSSSSGLWVPPCCRRHLWCPTLLLSSPLVHGGSMWQWVPPHSSLWLSPLVVVIELVPPPTRPCRRGCLLTRRHGCVVPPIHPCGHGCLLAHPRGRVVPPWSSSWLCLPGGHRGCVPSHRHGYGCSRSSSWSCGAPLVIVVVAMWCPPSGRHGCPRLSSWLCHPLVLMIVWCPSHHRHHGCPPLVIVLVAMWCPPLVLVVVWTPPRLLLWPCGASWPLVPSPACPHCCGCP